MDNLSLDSDLESIKLALHSVFEAAVELDTFLAEDSQSNEGGDNEVDDASFASEERRLHESELELRKELDFIDDSNEDEDETDSVDAPSLSREPMDAFSAESYESPETQVPLLQPVSPFGSPFSESSSSSDKEVSRCSTSPALEEPPYVARIESPKKRQIRAYGLRPHVEKSFTDLEASLEQLSPKGRGTAQLMANALFGRTEYTVCPIFSGNESLKRTVQGTVSVLIASGIVVADHAKESPHVLHFVFLVPLLIAALEAKLPHQIDEALLAVVILGTHVTMAHLSAF